MAAKNSPAKSPKSTPRSRADAVQDILETRTVVHAQRDDLPWRRIKIVGKVATCYYDDGHSHIIAMATVERTIRAGVWKYEP